MKLLKESPFHVRKEAAFALANICADGGGGTGARRWGRWSWEWRRGAWGVHRKRQHASAADTEPV